jgi:anti-sigma regulatory factor (Ser/Thr protein kinase)
VEQQPRASLNLNLPRDKQAPAAVRQAMSSLGAVGPSLGDAVMVASELVANAVRHSDGVEREAINVAVRRFDHHMLISVRDPGGSQREADNRPLIECAAEGLGRRIIEGLTSRWGSEQKHGYVLWAELPLTVYADTR